MTILQVTLQPFGILNALRNRFVIPFAISFLQRIALFNPKESFTYKTVGGLKRAAFPLTERRNPRARR